MKHLPRHRNSFQNIERATLIYDLKSATDSISDSARFPGFLGSKFPLVPHLSPLIIQTKMDRSTPKILSLCPFFPSFMEEENWGEKRVKTNIRLPSAIIFYSPLPPTGAVCFTWMYLREMRRNNGWLGEQFSNGFWAA